MNIKQAKEYIKQTVSLYLKKDDFDEYELPVVRQRPIFLLGAPGIGKTAIMEQVAEELNIALVSYAMTHHTRQSALGLPIIKKHIFDGVETEVTEYTMSEIIASIHNTMEKSGVREGILFLDEINCVSETLAPSMLQFLQYKEFGNHRIPEGWVVVTAGNPPEFNKSVREFDVVVMDRLKILEVEPDYQVFKEYASDRNIHPAVINFLDVKREFFYLIENTVKGRSYVTARGWEDLSSILLKYEEAGFTVEESLVSQYIRNTTVVKEFTAYYELYLKYKRDYGVKDILKGEYSDVIVNKAKTAPFDERLSLLGMLMDKVIKDMKDSVKNMDSLKALSVVLKTIGEKLDSGMTEDKGDAGSLDTNDTAGIAEVLKDMSDKKRQQLLMLSNTGAMGKDQGSIIRYSIRFLEEVRKSILNNNGDFDAVKKSFNELVVAEKNNSKNVSDELHYAFEFINKAFSDGNEMLIFVTNLTANQSAAAFLTRNPSEDYQKYHKELMIENRVSAFGDKL